MGGVSAIIGAIALLGFLAFLAGVGIVVVSASQGRPVRGGIIMAVLGLAFGLILSVISQGVIVVQPQEVAVVFQTLNGQLENPRGAGTHIIIPVVQEATIYPVRQQEYTMSDSEEEGNVNDAIVARTFDGQEVRLDVTVLFNIKADNVNELHQRWQDTYLLEFVRPTVRNLVRTQVAQYEAEAIYGAQRAEMEGRAGDAIRAAFEREALELTGFLVRSLNFSADFAQSIENKEVEEQDRQRAETEAQRRRIEAEGRANAVIAEAEGEARATILRAEAQARALSLISEQIAANPSLIQYEYIQSLADNISLALIPSNSPFLFDFESIENLPEPQTDFSAPQIPDVEVPTPEPTAQPGSGN
ncbi:MAG: SPFH domain-containing protein [Chloroflexota bacterium]